MLNKPEVDMVATYLNADMEAVLELPMYVRAFWENLSPLPAARFVLESLQKYGARATVLALRDFAMMEHIRGSH